MGVESSALDGRIFEFSESWGSSATFPCGGLSRGEQNSWFIFSRFFCLQEANLRVL